MRILGKRLLVSRLEEAETAEGSFKAVEVQDSFVYKGKVEQTTLEAFKLDIKVGDIVLFAKYSPDTHEVDFEGKKAKVISVDDVLAVL